MPNPNNFNRFSFYWFQYQNILNIFPEPKDIKSGQIYVDKKIYDFLRDCSRSLKNAMGIIAQRIVYNNSGFYELTINVDNYQAWYSQFQKWKNSHSGSASPEIKSTFNSKYNIFSLLHCFNNPVFVPPVTTTDVTNTNLAADPTVAPKIIEPDETLLSGRNNLDSKRKSSEFSAMSRRRLT